VLELLLTTPGVTLDRAIKATSVEIAADADHHLDEVALAIRECESGHDYRAENPVSSASGAWQFIDSTWEWVTGLAPPASAWPREVQDDAFEVLWDDGAGASHWYASRHCWGEVGR
jgi:hypothetical protein